MTYIGISPTVVHLAASVAIPNGGDGFTGQLTSVTADRTGQWIAIARATKHGPGCGVKILVNGGDQSTFQGYFWHQDVGGNTNGNPSAGDYWQGLAGAGTTFGVAAATGSFANPVGACYIDAYFIPTAQYPK